MKAWITVAFGMVLAACVCDAVTTEWGDAYAIPMYGDGTGTAVRGGETLPAYSVTYSAALNVTRFYLDACIGLSPTASGVTLKAADARPLANVGVALVRNDAGDVVDYNTTVAGNSAFLRYSCSDAPDDNGYVTSDYDIAIRGTAPTTIYLGFACNTFSDMDPLDERPPYYYGWLELSVSPTSIEVLDAAIDLRGRSIIVGQTPEPSVCVLMLLGLCAASLRRQWRH